MVRNILPSSLAAPQGPLNALRKMARLYSPLSTNVIIWGCGIKRLMREKRCYRAFGGPKHRTNTYKAPSSHHHTVCISYLTTELNMFLKAFIITIITSLVKGTFLNTSQSLKNHRVASSLGFATVRALD